jgi:hypothetical protein
MANQLDKYATPIEIIAAMTILHLAKMRIIIVAQNVKHLWHRHILPTTLLIVCGRFRCTASVQPIITAMEIRIIMRQ